MLALGASRFPSLNTLTPAYRLRSRAGRQAEGQELFNGPAVPPVPLAHSGYVYVVGELLDFCNGDALDVVDASRSRAL